MGGKGIGGRDGWKATKDQQDQEAKEDSDTSELNLTIPPSSTNTTKDNQVPSSTPGEDSNVGATTPQDQEVEEDSDTREDSNVGATTPLPVPAAWGGPRPLATPGEGEDEEALAGSEPLMSDFLADAGLCYDLFTKAGHLIPIHIPSLARNTGRNMAALTKSINRFNQRHPKSRMRATKVLNNSMTMIEDEALLDKHEANIERAAKRMRTAAKNKVNKGEFEFGEDTAVSYTPPSKKRGSGGAKKADAGAAKGQTSRKTPKKKKSNATHCDPKELKFKKEDEGGDGDDAGGSDLIKMRPHDHSQVVA
ncbi:hypothetical protein LTS15_007552 [Exophiala xenobiotica]|nr:hypothetical protein LTS15_007552 [Exophiala xenobiotica]